MKLILLGPPGVGKGTQAQRICNMLNAVQISTGDMLRSEIKSGTKLGEKAAKIINKGKLVSDDIILEMIENRLFINAKPASYILDGFPRTIPQAVGLSKMYEKHNEKLDSVILLESPEDIIIERLTARRSCKKCNKVYHLVTMPPKKDNICDVCSGELVQREDDKPETIKKRMKIYHEQTMPLANYYRENGLLKTVDASGTPDEVHENVKKILKC